MQLVSLLVLEILDPFLLTLYLFLLALNLFLLVFYFLSIAFSFLFKLILLSYNCDHIFFGFDKFFLDLAELRKGFLVVSRSRLHSNRLGFTLDGLLGKSALVARDSRGGLNPNGVLFWDSDRTLILERRKASIHICEGFYW